jgi:hypothetical protein
LKTKINFSSNKIAEMTTQQIVMLIILLTSFAVLLFFILGLDIQNLSEKEICQSSVQLAEKQSFFGSVDCKTDYICISGGGDCEKFTAKHTEKISFKDKKEAKNKVMIILAEKMADCWWMFGEGKVDYANKKVTDQIVCAVCAEIAFDEKIKEEIKDIPYSEFKIFLEQNYKNEETKQTYYDYLEGKYERDSNYWGLSIDLKEVYGIYTGRNSDGNIFNFLPFIGGGIANPMDAIHSTLLKRKDASQIECSYFVTTP